MNRLTQKRVNGIKTGYWSASKKDELVARVAEYEDTGLEPAEVLQLKKNAVQWIPVAEQLPEPGKLVLVCSLSHGIDGDCHNMQTGAILCDCWMVQTRALGVLSGGRTIGQEKMCTNEDTEVIAWMPLPEPYREV